MRLNDLDEQEIHAMQIRALQERFHVEHEHLLNWGAWSRDRAGIFPALAQTHIFEQFIHDGTEGYAEDGEAAQVTEPEAKAERSEETPYDELQGRLLDERMHGIGGLPEYQRIAVKIAYVTREVPEGQFHKHCACSQDGFLERLEAALRFVRRFV